MAKVGRPRLTALEHLQRGTFRRDRHGDPPAAVTQRQTAAAITPMLSRRPPSLVVDDNGAAMTGRALVAAVRSQFNTDDPVGPVLLQAAGAAHDRRLALARLLDGDQGLLARLAAGQVGLHASAVKVLLDGERQAAEAFDQAIDKLQLDADAPASNQKRSA